MAGFDKSDQLIRKFSIKHFTSPKVGLGFFNGTIEGEGAFPNRHPNWPLQNPSWLFQCQLAYGSGWPAGYRPVRGIHFGYGTMSIRRRLLR